LKKTEEAEAALKKTREEAILSAKKAKLLVEKLRTELEIEKAWVEK